MRSSAIGVIPAKAGIQRHLMCGRVSMPAFAGMASTSESSPILNDSRA